MATNEMNEARKRRYQADGSLNYFLEIFGDHIAEREGYRAYDGLEAIYFYLVQKHNWLPRDVRSMSLEDLRFVLSEEMDGWSVPAGTP